MNIDSGGKTIISPHPNGFQITQNEKFYCQPPLASNYYKN
jgi:hypothetical protein